MALRRLELALNSVGRRRFLTATPGVAVINFGEFVGNSLTRSSNCSSGVGTTCGASYPARFLQRAGGWAGKNTGVAGLKLTEMNASPYPALYTADYSPTANPGRRVALIEGGPNDIILDGASAATVNTRTASLVTTLAGIGYGPYLSTITPAVDTGALFIPSDYNTKRATINFHRRANWPVLGCLGLMDWAADPDIGPDSATGTGFYSPDSGFIIHPSDKGYARMGDIGVAAVVPAPSFHPASLANVALWLDYSALTTAQDSALTVAAAAGDPLGGWQGAVLAATQATAGSRPTLQANGVQFGNGKSLNLGSAIAATGNVTISGVITRASGEIVWALGSSTTNQGLVFFSDNILYIADGNGIAAVAFNLTGTAVQFQVRRNAGVWHARASGFAEVVVPTFTTPADGTLTASVVGARTNSGMESYTASTARLLKLGVFTRDLTTNTDAARVQAYLASTGAVAM